MRRRVPLLRGSGRFSRSIYKKPLGGTSYVRAGAYAVAPYAGPRTLMRQCYGLWGAEGNEYFFPFMTSDFQGIVLPLLGVTPPGGSTWFGSDCPQLSQGVGMNQFEGNTIVPRHILLRGVVSLGGASTDLGGFGQGFIAVVQDRSPRGTIPLAADIYGPITGAPEFAPQRRENADRFKVLWQKSFNCELTGTGRSAAITGGAAPEGTIVGVNTTSTYQAVNVSLKLPYGRSTNDGVSGTFDPGAIVSNALYLVFMSSGAGNSAVRVSSSCLIAKMTSTVYFTNLV